MKLKNERRVCIVNKQLKYKLTFHYEHKNIIHLILISMLYFFLRMNVFYRIWRIGSQQDNRKNKKGIQLTEIVAYKK